MIEMTEIAEVRDRGGVAELLGHFFDADGNTIQTSLTQRTLSVGLAELRERRIVAIAGGEERPARSGLFR